MKLTALAIEGVYAIDPERAQDERGWFARLWDADVLASNGLASRFVQQSAAWNERAGTIRGLHLALPPGAESKIVRCVRGAVHDVVLDARPASSTLGRHLSIRLDDENRQALYVPSGCAHGYQTLVDGTELFYDISEAYRADLASGINHADPALGIQWPLPVSALSARDARLPSLSEYLAFGKSFA